ncbi:MULTISPECIES: hypothetical protein [Bradyrhizobium]|uniref:Uncharacterized protein n=1 Tax=Bradyrhizobium frederickii TaxID=2560054 RepID=A0A4Y9L0I9_9BRAD|nr:MULTISPECIES: hypothetical protein [Bradyrhizobium]RTE90092.1 hypothetical protein D6B98_26810 [Bradyrhizobium sp. LVM 105]TFV36316.1 hypothetical protein E4K66_23685 [Bradyrhizobium frederickii]
MIMLRKLLIGTSAATAFAAGLFWNDTGGVFDRSFVAEAEARVGRPLTPMSYAGVARRTTRRAVVGAGVAAGAAGAYYGSSCVQVVDAYGRIVTRC